MSKFRSAVIQLNSGPDITQNLLRVEKLVCKAAEAGANLVLLPETVNVILNDAEPAFAEDIPGRTSGLLSSLARKHGIWLHGGSIFEKNTEGKPYNTSIMFDPNGNIIAKYRKLHLFDADISDGPSNRESDINAAGSGIVVADAEIGRLGFSICYDIRFPEMFRVMALRGAEIIFTPANFTYATGKAHWESILRCRAIENGFYIIAAGQCGENPRFRAYGHSMIISPWGEVLACLQDGEGIASAEIDTDAVERARKQIPCLRGLRKDVYAVTE